MVVDIRNSTASLWTMSLRWTSSPDGIPIRLPLMFTPKTPGVRLGGPAHHADVTGRPVRVNPYRTSRACNNGVFMVMLGSAKVSHPRDLSSSTEIVTVGNATLQPPPRPKRPIAKHGKGRTRYNHHVVGGGGVDGTGLRVPRALSETMSGLLRLKEPHSPGPAAHRPVARLPSPPLASSVVTPSLTPPTLPSGSSRPMPPPTAHSPSPRPRSSNDVLRNQVTTFPSPSPPPPPLTFPSNHKPASALTPRPRPARIVPVNPAASTTQRRV